MALAFKRAAAAADEKMKGCYGSLRDSYKLTADPPISFDWESAKACEGSSTFNANNEELPKSITMARFIADKAGYMSGMFSKLADMAKGNEELVWGAVAKHWKGVLVHFDDKGTKPGYVEWSLNSAKDGVLDVTMKFDFSRYTGNDNVSMLGVAILDFLEDAENLRFQLMKAQALKAGASTQFNNCTEKFLKEKLGDAAPPVVVNWDEMAATPGRFIEYGNEPPVRGSYLLAKLLVEGRLADAIRSGLTNVLKDNDGKEAFSETFKEIKINVTGGSAHSLSASKAGASLVFSIVVDLSNQHNAARAHDATAIGKAIEGML